MDELRAGEHRRGIRSGRAIRELPASERPRERLALRGPGGLSAAELIGLLWGSGSRGRSAIDLATEALARHDGLTGLANAELFKVAESDRQDVQIQFKPAAAA